MIKKLIVLNIVAILVDVIIGIIFPSDITELIALFLLFTLLLNITIYFSKHFFQRVSTNDKLDLFLVNDFPEINRKLVWFSPLSILFYMVFIPYLYIFLPILKIWLKRRVDIPLQLYLITPIVLLVLIFVLYLSPVGSDEYSGYGQGIAILISLILSVVFTLLGVLNRFIFLKMDRSEKEVVINYKTWNLYFIYHCYVLH